MKRWKDFFHSLYGASVPPFWHTVRQKTAFWAVLLTTGSVWLLSVLYYTGVLETNFPAGWLWLLSFLLLYAAFLHGKRFPAAWTAFWNRDTIPPEYGRRKRLAVLIFAVSAVYFLSHLYGYPSAPWNNYGLFDDAAWDIFIAREKCFTGNAFEIIFWNPDIGMISRELLFHYYISILFRLFGYNLFVFNMALILLGYVTVLFTALLADAIFHNVFYAFAAGIMLNFLPVEFTQVFMGHRYAICGPVMMVSLFFLYRAFQLRSVPYGVAGGVFAGFAMESAIMGKQYLWALLAAAFLYAAAYRRQTETLKAALPVILGVLLGYAVTTAPLYAYIATNGERYNIRQANLTAEFFAQIRAEGLSAVWRRMERLRETLFALHSWSRQFSDGFPILPWYLAVPAIAGSVAAFFKKHYVLPLMIAVPLAGNVVSESYDFRLLIAAPFMVLTAVYAFVWAVSHVPNRSYDRDVFVRSAVFWQWWN